MTQTETPLAAIILAAGKGTRMKSHLHKVLHPIAGQPMLFHLLDSLNALKVERKVVVVGAGREQLEAALTGKATQLAVQEPQLGTAHAVQQAQDALADFAGDVLILYGDVPLVRAQTLQAMRARLHAPDAPTVVVLGFEPADALAYGRIIAHEDAITKMVEHKDATEAERACRMCNSGLMAVRAADLFALLAQVGNDNASHEFYLVDIVNIAVAQGRTCALTLADEWEVAGVNSRVELAALEQQWQQMRRMQAMEEGASLLAPETVWFSHDTQLGRDVIIGANTVFAPGCVIADGVTIHGFCHFEGAKVAAGAEIGPFARLRPGADLGENSKVGNFVEVKKARLDAGAKVNHLSYIGDAHIGAKANVGAGTITCNYDGYFKHRTEIGAGAFIGSNSALVAPVRIGAGALVRAPQQEKSGWAARFRAAMKAKKEA
jgi:bifunctional UDP-N-acetylglucosamine pyrophosphorylase / glucosamine-1-phosphate N-acetyltransferase